MEIKQWRTQEFVLGVRS